MRFWFDTEFYEDGTYIDLISIGVVAEDGRQYYAETRAAYELCEQSQWLKENVKPHLIGGMMIKHRFEIHDDIYKFFGDAPEIWAYYADYDWVALCQIFGRMIDLPDHFPKFCMDVKQLAVMKGNPTLPKQESAEHHALADAIWCQQAWQFLQEV